MNAELHVSEKYDHVSAVLTSTVLSIGSVTLKNCFYLVAQHICIYIYIYWLISKLEQIVLQNIYGANL